MAATNNDLETQKLEWFQRGKQHFLENLNNYSNERCRLNPEHFHDHVIEESINSFYHSFPPGDPRQEKNPLLLKAQTKGYLSALREYTGIQITINQASMGFALTITESFETENVNAKRLRDWIISDFITTLSSVEPVDYLETERSQLRRKQNNLRRGSASDTDSTGDTPPYPNRRDATSPSEWLAQHASASGTSAALPALFDGIGDKRLADPEDGAAPRAKRPCLSFRCSV